MAAKITLYSALVGIEPEGVAGSAIYPPNLPEAQCCAWRDRLLYYASQSVAC